MKTNMIVVVVVVVSISNSISSSSSSSSISSSSSSSISSSSSRLHSCLTNQGLTGSPSLGKQPPEALAILNKCKAICWLGLCSVSEILFPLVSLVECKTAWACQACHYTCPMLFPAFCLPFPPFLPRWRNGAKPVPRSLHANPRPGPPARFFSRHI